MEQDELHYQQVLYQLRLIIVSMQPKNDCTTTIPRHLELNDDMHLQRMSQMPSELPPVKASLHLASLRLATLPQQLKLLILLNIAFLRKLHVKILIVQASSVVSC